MPESSILVHQALYGESGQAHRLLAKSSAEREPFDSLTSFTDKPPGDASSQWQPFVRGFSLENHYVWLKTFPDPNAKRGGMVRTYALVVLLNEAVRIEDLREIFSLFPRDLQDKPSQLEPLEVPFSSSPSFRPPDEGIIAVVRHLLAHHREPIVLIGQDGFEELIASLWQRLWPEARAALDFGLQFQPQDYDKDRINLWSTPTSVSARWANLASINLGSPPQNFNEELSKSQAYVLGLPQGEGIRQLIGELELKLEEFKTLRLLENCESYLSKPAPSFNENLTAARFVAHLAPHPKQGRKLKNGLFHQLIEQLPQQEAEAILSLRNFAFSAFDQQNRTFRRGVRMWADKHLLNGANALQVAEIWKEALAGHQLSRDSQGGEWASAVFEVSQGQLHQWVEGTAQAVWLWWQELPELVAGLGSILPSRAGESLSETCPNSLSPSLGKVVRALSVERQWLNLHAVVACASMNPLEAMQTHLKLDHKLDSLEAVRILSQHLEPEIFLEGTLNNPDPRLELVSGELCAQTPQLFSNLNVSNLQWQRVWLHSAQISGDIWQGISEPQRVTEALLNRIGVSEIEEMLLISIAQTPQADISDYSKRAAIWPLLPQNAAHAFLSATADSWLKKFVSGQTDLPLEHPLEFEVLNRSRLERYLLPVGSSSRILATLGLFKRFEQLPQALFIHFVERWKQGRGLLEDEAKGLGQLIAQRRWDEAAMSLFRAVVESKRGDFKPALSQCLQQLNFVSNIRAQFALSSGAHEISRDEMWKFLLTTATLLYPNGPQERKLWEQAEGDASHLPDAITGHSRWKGALDTLRQGGGGKITVKKLLRQMEHDFGGNPEIKLLRENLPLLSEDQ